MLKLAGSVGSSQFGFPWHLVLVVCEREVFDLTVWEVVSEVWDDNVVELDTLCPVSVTNTVTNTGWAVTVTNTVCALSRALEESAGSKAAPVLCVSAWRTRAKTARSSSEVDMIFPFILPSTVPRSRR